MSATYDKFFERIPIKLLRCISNGCSIGDKAYSQIMKSEPLLFQSGYMYGLRSRIHDKAIQMYLHDQLENETSLKVYSQHTGFGNRVLLVSGNSFGVTPCHIHEPGTLPQPARYKLKACENNPGENYDQFNLFMPPISEDFSYLHFFITVFFDGMKAVPTLVLPDNSFTTILGSRPIMSVIMTKEEVTYQERKLPKLISEVENENEKQDNA